jgi:hypothetical protein
LPQRDGEHDSASRFAILSMNFRAANYFRDDTLRIDRKFFWYRRWIAADASPRPHYDTILATDFA